MKIANFLANNEIYYLEHNKEPGVCTVETRNVTLLLVDVGDRVFDIDDTYIISNESKDSVTYHSNTYDSEFFIKTLEMSDANKIFPGTFKSFNDYDIFVNNVNEVLLASGTPNQDVDTLSYTLDTNNNILELIKTTPDGDISFRENGDWTALGPDEDAPTIFDQHIVDIDPLMLEQAVSNYDTNSSEGKDLTLDDVSTYVSVLAK